jgi:hypothetical protein
MRKVLFLLIFVVSLASCYKGDIDDLNRKYDALSQEQKRQAELLATLEEFMKALENKLTVVSVTAEGGGYKIVFSDGSDMTVGSAIVSVVEEGGSVTFHLSDGSTVTMRKTETVGMYVLSEGSWGQGDGQLAYFDRNSSSDRFLRNEGRRIKNYGETPNDLLIYGSKMYCAISGAVDSKGDTVGSMVRVINVSTGATVRDIAVTRGAAKQQPRRLAAVDGKVYVSLYSGALARIDTASFTFDVISLGGTYSEGMCVAGQSLYVCNSGQGAGNTVSIVSLAQFTETETLLVPKNPVNIVNAGNGELYLNTAAVWEGYTQVAPSNVHVIDVAGKRIVAKLDLEVETLAAGRDCVYAAGFDWNTYSDTFRRIVVSNRSVSDFTDPDVLADNVMMGYKLSVNPLNGEVFLTQQLGQDVYRFRADGTYVETLKTGQQNGSAVAFVNAVK